MLSDECMYMLANPLKVSYFFLELEKPSRMSFAAYHCTNATSRRQFGRAQNILREVGFTSPSSNLYLMCMFS